MIYKSYIIIIIHRFVLSRLYNKTMSDKEILLKLASKIIYERKRKNLSQEELAGMANLNMRSISMIENGLSNVKFLTLYKIALALNVDISCLVDLRL